VAAEPHVAVGHVGLDEVHRGRADESCDEEVGGASSARIETRGFAGPRRHTRADREHAA
jgi:hypothetical protein